MPLRISMQVTVPKEVISSRELREAIIRAQQRETAPGLKRLFNQTVEGWKNKPDWMQHQEITSNRIAMRVWAGGQYADQYAIVNFGSPAHMILPRKGGFLSFKRGYHASTRPRILSSRANSRFGENVFSRGVHHPGFEARSFAETIAEEYSDTFAEDMQDAIGKVAAQKG